MKKILIIINDNTPKSVITTITNISNGLTKFHTNQKIKICIIYSDLLINDIYDKFGLDNLYLDLRQKLNFDYYLNSALFYNYILEIINDNNLYRKYKLNILLLDGVDNVIVSDEETPKIYIINPLCKTDNIKDDIKDYFLIIQYDSKKGDDNYVQNKC